MLGVCLCILLSRRLAWCKAFLWVLVGKSGFSTLINRQILQYDANSVVDCTTPLLAVSPAWLAGGKTASLKTLGLLVLMAKAGLFLPVAPSSHEVRDAHQTGSDPSSKAKGSSGCEEDQGLAWYGEVLADLGDSQDLAQSLSTFSGHVQRVCKILESAKSSSLVLLDEVNI